jgi:TetR/AcrR family transcriptional repressor of nem operon
MGLVEAHIRDGGDTGFSFRNLAAEVGIKSASVPTKAKMAAAVARRYGDRFLASVAPQTNESAGDAVFAYRSAFTAAPDIGMVGCVFAASSAPRLKHSTTTPTSTLSQITKRSECEPPAARVSFKICETT